MKRFAIIAIGLAMTGCAVAPLAYPANDIARTAGNIRVEIKMYGTGAGPITIYMPDGEMLTGRYSEIYGGSVGFGNIYAQAYGTGGFSSGSGFGTSTMISASGQVIADAIGPKGTTAHCEVVSNTLTGHGNGACQTSGGGIYRMQF